MSQKPIHVFARWQVKEGQLDVVLNILLELARQSSGEEGNLFYKVHQSSSDPNTLILFEGYRDQSALDEHRNSEHFQTLVIGSIIPLLAAREVILSTQLY